MAKKLIASAIAIAAIAASAQMPFMQPVAWQYQMQQQQMAEQAYVAAFQQELDRQLAAMTSAEREGFIAWYWTGLMEVLAENDVSGINAALNIFAPVVRKYDAQFDKRLQMVYNTQQYILQLANSGMPGPGLGGGEPLPTFSGGSSPPASTPKTCSLCHGKGWIEGCKTPVYEGVQEKRWCSECGKMVNPSHSHDPCPSCRWR